MDAIEDFLDTVMFSRAFPVIAPIVGWLIGMFIGIGVYMTFLEH